MRQDLRYALRFFVRNPSFAVIAVATLAFGIAANTSMFTMADALALRGLPYPHAEQLAAIETHISRQNEVEPWTSAPDFTDLRDHSEAFARMAAISPIWNDIVTGSGDAERLDTLYVSATFFPLLGVQAAVGRTFSPAEDNGSHPSQVVVLSNAFWLSHFNGDRNVVGTNITLSGQPYRIIGVLPADFRYLGDPLTGTAKDIEAWLPLSDNILISRPRTVRFLKVIGRLKPGISMDRARTEIRDMGQTLTEQFQEADKGFAYEVLPLSEKVSGHLRLTMLLLLGSVGFVLLMACANVANLLLTRAAARQKDFAVRVALGASRLRLLQQILAEGFLISVMGGITGTILAYWGIQFLVAEAPANLTGIYSVRLDLRALLFTLCSIAVCTLASGIPPAWNLLRGRIHEAWSQMGRSFTASNHGLRSVLVAAQIAVALILLVGAGLVIRSFQRLLDVDPGFDSRNLVTISTQMPPTVTTGAQATAVFNRIRNRLQAVPGVVSTGAVSRLPLMGSNLGSTVFVEGKSVPGQQGADVEYRVATPNYFSAMRIPLRQGRLFDEHDDAHSLPVALVSESMARQTWPGESAVGKRIKLGPNTETQAWITVVGVVGDVHHFGLDVGAPPEVYRPYAASPLFAPILVVRTAVDPESMADLLASKVRSADTAVPAYDVFLMQTLVNRSTAQRRFIVSLLSGFALIALLLACVGVYGALSQAVAQRTQELGLRIALGSTSGEAMRLIFRDGMKLAFAGIAAGSIAAAALASLMQNLLFEVRPLDPAAFLAAAGVLALCAALACYVPARRATRVDPLTALRENG